MVAARDSKSRPARGGGSSPLPGTYLACIMVEMNSPLETKWHTLSTSEIFKILESEEHGLSESEASKRLTKFGRNALPEAKVDSIPLIFLRQFASPLIYILLFAGIAVLFIGETIDSLVILAVLVLNAIVGSIQEGRARNTLMALKKFIETKALVLRDGRQLIIPDTEVVPGDIIVLEEGSKIPADARIISARNLKVDESALTGESEAEHKDALASENSTLPIIEAKNMVFKGTNIASGLGEAVVVKTGVETVIGKIAKEIASIDTEIPLKTNIRLLSRLIIIITFAIAIFLLVFGVLTGKPLGMMLATVISITVSVIPEGLPVAITIVLASGVWRMSKRNALVKRLQAVEALGQAGLIAVDKTGTITRNEMMVQTAYIDGKSFEIGGAGYEPKGEVRLSGLAIDPPNHPELLLLGKLATYCANANAMFDEEKKIWRVSGDPTEAALGVFGRKLGFIKEDLERESPLLFEVPFDYSLKYHSTLHKEPSGSIMTVVGAPEVILNLSSKIWSNGEEVYIDKEKIENLIIENSLKGLRVLGVAMKKIDSNEITTTDADDLVFVGFLGLKDGLRAEVKESARRAIEAGIRVVMITGDHQSTAKTIAEEAHIFRPGDRVLTGAEVEKLSDKELESKVMGTSVFARVTPEHKLRIINAFKANGLIVAMTGDGVNDAPSLVAADLGVAMGRTGTEVAKEAADIVLLDDNFGSIVSAVEEGRSIYMTIKKVVLYLTSTSIGELLVITGALLLGFPLPLLPAQIIWLNFVTDGFFTVALALEPREKNLLRQNFEKPKKYLVDKLMVVRMIVMSLPMMIGTLILFQRYYPLDMAKAWTVSLTILAVYQWLNAWNCRSENKSVFALNPFSNIYMIMATLAAALMQLLAVYHPLFQRFLRTVPLELSDWVAIIAFSTFIIFAEEIRKIFTWQKQKHSSSSAPQLQASQI